MSTRKPQIKSSRWLPVMDPRYSDASGFPELMMRLDFSRWWTESGGFTDDTLFLKVPMRAGAEPGMENTIHRVRCRYSHHPRLAMKDGVLYWLVKAEERRLLPKARRYPARLDALITAAREAGKEGKEKA